VEAEDFLLRCQQLAVGPLPDTRRGHRRRTETRGAGEQTGLAALPVSQGLLASLDGCVHAGEEGRPGGAQMIERAGLHEGLEDTLVDGAQIDRGAEGREGSEGTVRDASLDDRPRGPL